MQNGLMTAPGLILAKGIGEPRQIDGVQILRGVAASMVVFHHFCLLLITHGGHSRIANFHNLARVGAAGVDIFFVISGFIITYSATKPGRVVSWSQFASARVKRIVPLYWVCTFLMVVMWATHKMLKSLVLTPALLAGSLLFLPVTKYQIGGPTRPNPIVDQGWTLEYEMFFYLVCTLVIAGLGNRRLIPAAPLAVIFVVIAARIIPGAPAYLGDPLMLEFVAGTVLGWATVTGRIGWLDRTAGWAAIAFGAAGLLGSAFLADPDAVRVLAWGVPGFLLVTGSIILVPSRNPFTKCAIFLGNASYSIYLGHAFLLIAVTAMFKSGHFASAGDAFLIVATLLSIAITTLLYTLVEKPITVRLTESSVRAADPLAPQEPSNDEIFFATHTRLSTSPEPRGVDVPAG